MGVPDPVAITLLDAGVVRDMADALDGRWTPEAETNPRRAGELLAAARLRLYGHVDRLGSNLVTYQEAKVGALRRGDAEWTVGFLADVSKFDGAPTREEIDSLIRIYTEAGLVEEARHSLAWAQLYKPVRAIVTSHPRSYRHSRPMDLTGRIELLTAVEAVEAMELAPGEDPWFPPPAGSPVADATWWRP